MQNELGNECTTKFKFKDSASRRIFNELVQKDIDISAMLNNNLVQPHNL
jgi:hypothetical protein